MQTQNQYTPRLKKTQQTFKLTRPLIQPKLIDKVIFFPVISSLHLLTNIPLSHLPTERVLYLEPPWLVIQQKQKPRQENSIGLPINLLLGRRQFSFADNSVTFMQALIFIIHRRERQRNVSSDRS